MPQSPAGPWKFPSIDLKCKIFIHDLIAYIVHLACPGRNALN